MLTQAFLATAFQKCLKKLKGKFVMLIYDIVASCKIAKVKSSTAMDASITESPQKPKEKKKEIFKTHTCKILV